MIYLKLIFAFLKVGLFSFGGGYAALPLIQHQIVTVNGWITAEEFTNLISISQLTPGSIAVNASTFVGIRVAGFPGALCATLGCVLPSAVIVLILVWIYKKYQNYTAVDGAMSAVRPVIVGLVLSAGISIMLISFFEYGIQTLHVDVISILIAASGIVLMKKTKISPLLLMILSGGVGLACYLLLDLIKA